MKIDILTLFPDLFSIMESYGVIGRAMKEKKLDIQVTNIRDFTYDKHRTVDASVFGGAPGMLMKAEPVVESLESVKGEDGHIIYLSPQGRILDQDKARDLAKMPHLVLLCGHYEGIDSRVVNHFVDEEISIGDYVLTGGELPAMVLMDSVVRWIDGVLGNEESAPGDSLANGLLQHDEFTKPRDFRGYLVPEVLLSGNHQAIDEWREASALENTRKKRPDLYQKYCQENIPSKKNLSR